MPPTFSGIKQHFQRESLMLNIYPIPALDTNYFWLLQPESDSPVAYIIDPGAAVPVIEAVEQQCLELAGIIITHHHHDHIGGIDGLVERYKIPVYGPHSARIPQITHPLWDGDQLHLPGLLFDVMEIPGHTQDHLAYYHKPISAPPQLFCGDTLFIGGCGRLLDGTAAQLHQSLRHLTGLPRDTLIYCGHEYTLANLEFAQAVEPDNKAVSEALLAAKLLRAQHLPTVPGTLASELATNPFLRTQLASVKNAAETYCGRSLQNEVEIFSVLREWKNHF
jgi:hydroxyacylglutathione hydrolase